MRAFLFTAAMCAAAAGSALAQNVATVHPFEGTFEEATFSVESAILGRGLVIDFVTHTGEMLARTAGDVGSDVVLFEAADVFLFCSAVLSRKVMEADPMNIAHCPYGIFVTDRAGVVSVGYRNTPEGAMQEVQALLEAIAREAVGDQ